MSPQGKGLGALAAPAGRTRSDRAAERPRAAEWRTGAGWRLRANQLGRELGALAFRWGRCGVRGRGDARRLMLGAGRVVRGGIKRTVARDWQPLRLRTG